MLFCGVCRQSVAPFCSFRASVGIPCDPAQRPCGYSRPNALAADVFDQAPRLSEGKVDAGDPRPRLRERFFEWGIAIPAEQLFECQDFAFETGSRTRNRLAPRGCAGEVDTQYRDGIGHTPTLADDAWQ